MKAKFSNPLTKLTDSPVVPLMSFLVDVDTFRLSQIIGKSDTKDRALDAIPLITQRYKVITGQNDAFWNFLNDSSLVGSKMVKTSADLMTQGQPVRSIESLYSN